MAITQRHPIIVLMEDPIIHTTDHPYCLDSTCPCQPTFEALKAWFLGLSPDDGREREVYAVHVLPGLSQPVWLIYEWVRMGARPSLSVVHPVSLVDGKLEYVHWLSVEPEVNE